MAKTLLEKRAEQSVKDRTLVMVRRLSAPPKRVFEAWTDEQQLAKWMRPQDLWTAKASTDPREGGSYRIAMRSSEGKEFTASGQYCEMRHAERIVMTWAWQEEGGHGPVTCVTIELKPAGKATEMRFHHALFEDKATRNSHMSGWRSIFDKLAAYCKRTSLN